MRAWNENCLGVMILREWTPKFLHQVKLVRRICALSSYLFLLRIIPSNRLFLSSSPVVCLSLVTRVDAIAQRRTRTSNKIIIIAGLIFQLVDAGKKGKILARGQRGDVEASLTRAEMAFSWNSIPSGVKASVAVTV